jgi:hypothetical protein
MRQQWEAFQDTAIQHKDLVSLVHGQTEINNALVECLTALTEVVHRVLAMQTICLVAQTGSTTPGVTTPQEWIRDNEPYFRKMQELVTTLVESNKIVSPQLKLKL